jgi:pimeloyl-ACP methyl ester carboxylesterase
MSTYTPEEALTASGPWTHREIAANGARFHAVSAGQGPLVLLLHGFPMYWWTWRSLVPALAEAGYRAVAVDLRGFGGSDHPPRGYDLFSAAKDTAGIIRGLGEPNATVVGHGLGAMLGWSTAALEPDVVNRLVAISTAHPVQMRHALLSDRGQLAASGYIFGFQRPWLPERQLVSDDAAQIEHFLRSWSGDPAWPDDDTSAHYRAAFQLGNTAHCALEYYRWSVRSILRADGRRFAAQASEAKINVPVLQIQGASDRTVLPRTAAGSRKFVTGPYAWRSLPGVGHFPQEERSLLVDSLILDWLASDPPWNDPPPEQAAITA